MRARTLVWTLAGLVLLVAAYAGSAVLAMRGLARSAAAGDAGAVIAQTDVPRLRSSIASQIAAAMLATDERAQRLSPLERSVLGGVVGGAVDAVVAEMLRPEALAALLRSGQVPAAAGVAVPRLPSAEQLSVDGLLDLIGRFGVIGPLEFAVRVSPAASGSAYAGFRLRFGGLGWKLSGIDLPRAVLDEFAARLRRT